MQEPNSTATYQAPKPKQPKQPAIPKGVTSYAQKPAVFGDVSGLTIDHVNQVVDQVDQAHKRLFGTKPAPSLVYDVTRGVSKGIVKDINHLFDVPLSPQQGQVRRTAREVQASTPDTISATDPKAAAAIVKAQGHPLSPQQKAQLGMAQGTETYAKARDHLVQAGILPKLQIVHDEKDFLTQLTGGAFLFATGLMTAAPILAIEGGYSAYKDAKNLPLGSFGFHNPFGARPEKVAPHLAGFAKGTTVGVIQKTFNDGRALATGNMTYLRANPDAYYNIPFLLLGGAGALSRLSGGVAVLRSDGLAAAGRHMMVPPTPPRKIMTLGDHQVEAINFDNPVVRWADNLRTDRMKKRSMAGKEPVPAAVLRALHVPYASDFISKTFSYEAKMRRENEAYNRTKYQAQTHLVRILDTITSAAIDATSYLDDIPKITKNQLSLGEMKALHVIAQGGDVFEAAQTMREAHEVWRDFGRTAGSELIAKDHEAQLVALKLAEKFLRDREAGIVKSKPFEKVLPVFKLAAEEATTLKIDKLGLSPESSDMRTAMEFDVYKRQRALPNRKKIAALIKGAQTRVDRLEKRKGYVPPEHMEKRANAQEAVDNVLETLSKQKLISERYRKGNKDQPIGALVPTEDLLDALHLEHTKTARGASKVGGLASDLKRQGFEHPVELDYDYEHHTITVGNGNHRVLAAHEAGMSHVPVVFSNMGDTVKEFYESVRGGAGEHEVARTKRVKPMDAKVRRKFDRPTEIKQKEGSRTPQWYQIRAGVKADLQDGRTITIDSEPKSPKGIEGELKGHTDEGAEVTFKAEDLLHTYDKFDGSLSFSAEATMPIKPSRYGHQLELKPGEETSSLEIARSIGLNAQLITKPGMTAAEIADHPELVKLKREIASAEKKIAKFQEQDHPDLAAARKRLDALNLLMDTAEERIANAEQREGAFRMPVYSKDRAITGSVSNLPPPRRANQFGEYLPASPAEVTHSFTGRALLAGDIRLDFTNIMARSLAKTVRAAMWVDDYNAKLRSAVEAMPEGDTARFFAPLRKKADINDKIREIVNNIHEPGVTAEDFASLTDTEVAELNQRTYAVFDPERNVWVEHGTHKPINVKDYAWYDSRAFTPDRGFQESNSGLKSTFNTIYNWVGRPRIFLAPRYILNLPSNYAMNALHEGIMTPQALAASYYGHKIYTADTLRRIDERLGFGRSKSYGPTRTPKTPPGKLMNEIVQGWHWVTDVHPRRAAFLYEAWRKGYSSAEDMERLVKDPANLQDFNEVARRAEKSMVELSNMTWAEQEWIRHVMFVYPWRSRQALWSVRTLAEHPAHSAILAEIGENAIQGEEKNKPLWIQAAIKKYLQLGYVITGWNPDGSPKGVQAGMLNTFSGLGDVMGVTGVSALAGGSFSFDSLDPGLQLFFEAAKGQDNFGRDLPGKGSPKQILSAFLDVAIYQTPIALAFKRGGKFAAEKPIPAFNPSQRGSLLAQINAGQRRVALSPGWYHGYGMLFSGNVTPRSIDKWKMLYDYYHSLTPEERFKYEGNLIDKVLNTQSQLLQRPIPEGVHTAIAVTREFQYRQQQWTDAHGATDGVHDMQKDQILLDTLKSRGLISAADAAKEMKRIESIPGLEQKDHTQARSALMMKYAKAGELHQWDSDMKRLVTFTPEGFKGKVSRMRDLGFRVPEPAASQKTLEELGRRTLGFEDKVRKVTKQISEEPDRVRKADLRAQLTDLLAEGDQPTVIGGTSFPSVSRLGFSDLSEQDRRDHIVSVATQKWTSLSSLDRELLAGSTQSPTVDRIWAAIDATLARDRASLKPGQSLKPGLKNYYIQNAAKSYPEFKEALKVAGQPLADRLSTYQVIRKSPVKDYWNVLLSTASQFAADKIKQGWVRPESGKPDWSAIQTAWNTNAPAIAQWIASQDSPEFKREYREFAKSDRSFYQKLVKP